MMQWEQRSSPVSVLLTPPAPFHLEEALSRAEARQLAVAMAAYWGSLAHAGDPNYADGVAWPRSPAVLGLDDDVSTRTNTRRPECLDFWAPWLGFY